MITLICGTGGSGKTHLVEEVMNLLGPYKGYIYLKRARDKRGGYYWSRQAIVGRYQDVLSGGCDNFSWKGAADDIEALVLQEAEAGRNVLLEGLTAGSWGVNRLARLANYDLLVIHLNTPLEVCLYSIEMRKEFLRQHNLDPVQLDPQATITKHHTLQTVIALRRKNNILVEELSRTEAFERTMKRMDSTWI